MEQTKYCPKCDSYNYEFLTVIPHDYESQDDELQDNESQDDLLYKVYKCHVEDVQNSTIYKLMKYDSEKYNELPNPDDAYLYSSPDYIDNYMENYDDNEIIVYDQRHRTINKYHTKCYMQNGKPIIYYISRDIYSYIYYDYEMPWERHNVNIYNLNENIDCIILVTSSATKIRFDFEILFFNKYQHTFTWRIPHKDNYYAPCYHMQKLKQLDEKSIEIEYESYEVVGGEPRNIKMYKELIEF